MDKEKLRQELEQKKNELYELEKALKDAEYEEFKVSFKNTMIIEKKIKTSISDIFFRSFLTISIFLIISLCIIFVLF